MKIRKIFLIAIVAFASLAHAQNVQTQKKEKYVCHCSVNGARVGSFEFNKRITPDKKLQWAMDTEGLSYYDLKNKKFYSYYDKALWDIPMVSFYAQSEYHFDIKGGKVIKSDKLELSANIAFEDDGIKVFNDYSRDESEIYRKDAVSEIDVLRLTPEPVHSDVLKEDFDFSIQCALKNKS